VLTRRPIFETKTFAKSLVDLPLNVHANSTGMSPEDMVHCIEIVSPASGISSPNVNGVILGGTNLSKLIANELKKK